MRKDLIHTDTENGAESTEESDRGGLVGRIQNANSSTQRILRTATENTEESDRGAPIAGIDSKCFFVYHASG